MLRSKLWIRLNKDLCDKIDELYILHDYVKKKVKEQRCSQRFIFELVSLTNHTENGMI